MKWVKDDIDGYLNFYSVSGDGRVSNWTIAKTAMWCTDVMSITFAQQLNRFSEETRCVLKGNVCANKNLLSNKSPFQYI